MNQERCRFYTELRTENYFLLLYQVVGFLSKEIAVSVVVRKAFLLSFLLTYTAPNDRLNQQ